MNFFELDRQLLKRCLGMLADSDRIHKVRERKKEIKKAEVKQVRTDHLSHQQPSSVFPFPRRLLLRYYFISSSVITFLGKLGCDYHVPCYRLRLPWPPCNALGITKRRRKSRSQVPTRSLEIVYCKQLPVSTALYLQRKARKRFLTRTFKDGLK